MAPLRGWALGGGCEVNDGWETFLLAGVIWLLAAAILGLLFGWFVDSAIDRAMGDDDATGDDEPGRDGDG